MVDVQKCKETDPDAGVGQRWAHLLGGGCVQCLFKLKMVAPWPHGHTLQCGCITALEWFGWFQFFGISRANIVLYYIKYTISCDKNITKQLIKEQLLKKPQTVHLNLKQLLALISLFSQKTWTQTCRAAWGRVRRSPCLLPLCPARWHLPQCHPEETPLVASLAWSWVSSDCPELCCFVCFLHACELHNLSLTVHLLDLFH